MRKVMVKRLVLNKTIGRWIENGEEEALFHQFGSDYEEFENGGAMFSIAIVEYYSGEVEMVRADRIRFIDTPKESRHD